MRQISAVSTLMEAQITLFRVARLSPGPAPLTPRLQPSLRNLRTVHPDILTPVMRCSVSRSLAFVALLSCLLFIACHKQEQEVAGVAQKAAAVEHRVQAANTLRDQQRAALEQIPLPTKSLYVDIHDPSEWKNPFLTVEADRIDLRIIFKDANTSTFAQDTMLRPSAARRQELQIRLSDLPRAITALPPEAWRYGRVVAIAEAPNVSPKDRPTIRRNVEAVIQQLNDLGVVVDEWPGR